MNAWTQQDWSLHLWVSGPMEPALMFSDYEVKLKNILRSIQRIHTSLLSVRRRFLPKVYVLSTVFW